MTKNLFVTKKKSCVAKALTSDALKFSKKLFIQSTSVQYSILISSSRVVNETIETFRCTFTANRKLRFEVCGLALEVVIVRAYLD